MGKAYKSSQTATHTKAPTKAANPTVTASTIGTTAVHTRANSSAACVVVRASGENQTIRVLTLMKESSRMKRNKAMGCLYGRMAVNI